MREVLVRAAAGDSAPQLTLDVYLHRLRSGIGAMTASLGGLDVLVFTGGVGEKASELRARTVGGLGFLGLTRDARLNSSASGGTELTAAGGTELTAAGGTELTAAGARGRTLVVRAREDLEIARQVRILRKATTGIEPV